MTVSSSTINKIISLISVLLVILLFALISLNKNDPQIYPSISSILNTLFYNLTTLRIINAFLSTILRVLITIVVSMIISFVFALLYYYNHHILAFIKPLIVVMKAAPIAAISIYIYIVVRGNISLLRPLLIALFVVLPIILEAFIGAIGNVDKRIVNELRLVEGPKIYKFVKIYLPLITPTIIISLLQTIGLGFKVLVMGEFIVFTQNSVGHLLHEAFDNFDMASLIAITLEIVIIVTFIEFVVKKAKKKLINYN